jgi:hypothetical protein
MCRVQQHVPGQAQALMQFRTTIMGGLLESMNLDQSFHGFDGAPGWMGTTSLELDGWSGHLGLCLVGYTAVGILRQCDTPCQ